LWALGQQEDVDSRRYERTLKAVSCKAWFDLALCPSSAQFAAPAAHPIVGKQCLTPLLGPSLGL